MIKVIRNGEGKVSDDGVTHVNIYSRGKTELGRLLSNLSHENEPITLPYQLFGEDVVVRTAEAAWYITRAALAGLPPDTLHAMTAIGRRVNGYDAKKQLRPQLKDIPGELFEDNTFCAKHEKIMMMVACDKLLNNPKIGKMFLENTLPLGHYYYYGLLDKDNLSIVPMHGDAMLFCYSVLQDAIQEKLKNVEKTISQMETVVREERASAKRFLDSTKTFEAFTELY